MSLTKRSHEGYLVIDHRAGDLMPGLPKFLEGATYTCSHCSRVVFKSPTRKRERAYCPKCDHYICDSCGAARAASGGECRPMKQIVDEAREAAVLEQQRNTPIILTAKE